ncbi:MAG: thioether cross-link-forming SCIFF peptide maturase, partial [Lachnospiraceae bacterium]|nr:thioether cross-link-forming SCIFF peptide maturase [Lachnospiraceae bacterium]
MIHQYKSNGYNIVLDVNSGSVHVVDDLVYDILALYEKESKESITKRMMDKYQQEPYVSKLEEAISEEYIAEAFAEIETLK